MCFPSLWVETKKTKKICCFFLRVCFLFFFLQSWQVLERQEKEKKKFRALPKSNFVFEYLHKITEHMFGFDFSFGAWTSEVFTWWCIHPHNEVTSRLLFSISDEFKYFSPFTLFINSNSAELHRIIFFLWYISQTHSCVNAAGPELAARCVKAKESLPLLRGRIHQNHQGIAKVEQLSPSKESAKKNRRRKKSGRVADYVLLLL